MQKTFIKFLFAFFIFSPLTLICQNSDSTKTRKRIPIEIICSPDFCYRTLKADAANKSITNFRDSLEIPKFGFTVGLNFFIHRYKNFYFQAGIQFSDKGEKTKKYDLIWPQPDPSLPVKNSFIYHYQYLDIPIAASHSLFRIQKVSFLFLKKIMHGLVPTSDIEFFVSGGLSTNIFLTKRTTSILEYNDGHAEKTNSNNSGFSRINFAATIGVGINYMLTTRLMFNIEPIFRRSITPIIDSPIKDYLYSVGMNVKIYYLL